MTMTPARSLAESPIALGEPRFADAEARSLAAAGDLIGAWKVTIAGRDFAQALESVRGPFAVGIVDASGRTLMAVDRFSEYTLCYREEAGSLYAAAHADALRTPSTPVDTQAVFDYLYFHVIPSPRTIFSGVARLPAGHCLVQENGGCRVEPYWRPRFEEDRSRSLQGLKVQFLELVGRAVERRATIGPPACFLSGGTDSSTVAGMLSRCGRGQPATFSIGFDAQGYDEMAFARIAARHFGTDHHEYYVTPDDLVRWMPELAAFVDQPFGNSSCLPAFLCAKLARDGGVQRILAGDGGDELFGGNSRYAKQRVFDFYDKVPRGLRTGLIEPALGVSGAARVPGLRKVASYVEQASTPMPDRLQLYNLVMRLGLQRVLTPAMLARVDPEASLRLQREVWAQPGPCSSLNRELAYDWRFTLAENDLPKVSYACAKAGVEVAFPLLDDDLLAFSLTLPSGYKLKGAQLRWFFKEALKGFLPDEIIRKKKHGFGLPFGVWALRSPPLRALAGESVHALVRRGIVRSSFAQELLEQRLQEHPGYYGEMVWILTMLELWFAAKAPDFRIES